MSEQNNTKSATKGRGSLNLGRRTSSSSLARHATGLIREKRLDGSPLKICEFVAHDSRLQFGSLNHAPGGTINPRRPVAADTTALILLALSGAQRTWPGLPPVRGSRE